MLRTNMDESPKMLSRGSKREYAKYDATYVKFKRKKTKQYILFKNIERWYIYTEN